MSIYLKKSIINTIIDIKKLIYYIINDNTVLSPNYNKCISELYYILMKTFKKIENCKRLEDKVVCKMLHPNEGLIEIVKLK